jgi:hypothetical protein
MSDVLSDTERGIEAQLRILQESAAAVKREATELLTSPRMITILGKQRAQKLLRWFQNRISCTPTKSARVKISAASI